MSAACPSVGRLAVVLCDGVAGGIGAFAFWSGRSCWILSVSSASVWSEYWFRFLVLGSAGQRLHYNGARVRELAANPLVQLFTQRIREVGQVNRDLLRFLVLNSGPVDDRRDGSLLVMCCGGRTLCRILSRTLRGFSVLREPFRV